MKLCDLEKCYGCFSCVNACPKQCITMIIGVNGHIVPKIDREKCVDCGLCEKSCPALVVAPALNFPKYTFASWNPNKKEQEKSSSGGISAVLAQQMIQDGGVVYGAAFDEKWNVNHVRCETYEDIQAICKSKYVQSWINDTYKLVREDLKQQRKVMFVGTPCQIAGLKTFLKKTYEELLTVDLVCHGVPSRALYREEIEKKARIDELKSITFRGDYGYGLGFYYNDLLESFSIRQSYYMRGFMDGLFDRECCYQCPFAEKKRIGDITIGDFWGIGNIIPFNNQGKNRVSMVLVNTDKGETWYKKIQQRIFFEERTIGEAVSGNSQLRHPTIKPENYEIFKKLYPKYGLKKAAEHAYPKMRLRLLLEKYKIIKITQ